MATAALLAGAGCFWALHCPGLRQAALMVTPVYRARPPFPPAWYVEDLASGDQRLVIKVLGLYYFQTGVPQGAVAQVVSLARSGPTPLIRRDALSALVRGSTHHGHSDWLAADWLCGLIADLRKDRDPAVRALAARYAERLGLAPATCPAKAGAGKASTGTGGRRGARQ